MTDIVQYEMNLFPVKEVEVDGIQMGVLSDGTPYLTARGLARMCGVDHAALIRLANNWDDEKTKPRGKKIAELLASQGHNGEHLYRRTKGASGETHAYVDAVCMAVLEYYAFEATQGSSETALRNFRLLARYSFRQFIYNRVGYDPTKRIPDSWKNFHERVILNDSVPANYFSVFREIADLVIHMIQAGITIDDHTVPDGSVGGMWSKYWISSGFDVKYKDYGVRKKHPHFFPDWFPQAAANPIEAWIYPTMALGDFRIWLYDIYIPKNFPGYIDRKVKSGVFLPSHAELVIEAVSKKTSEIK
jgi:hypothetical protein